MTIRFVVTLLIGSLLTGSALAQPSSRKAASQITVADQGNPKFERHFANTDTNGDGFICREEAAGHQMLARDFHIIDMNKDGKLSKTEMLTPRKLMLSKSTNVIEVSYRNSDSEAAAVVYSKAEVEAAMLAEIERNFDVMDSNRDGKVSKEELQAARNTTAASSQAKLEEWFTAADLDEDGLLTKQEAEAAGRAQITRKFDRQDRNKDGNLTRNELRQAIPPYMRRAI